MSSSTDRSENDDAVVHTVVVSDTLCPSGFISKDCT